MSLLARFFASPEDKARKSLLPVYRAVVAKARQPRWFEQGHVPDTIDGRFEMLAAMLCLLLLRMEGDEGQKTNSVLLTEIFVEDMDAQLREIGIGDMVVGKHIGKMMAALGGRLGAYRNSIANKKALREAITRNIFDGHSPGKPQLDFLVAELQAEKARLDNIELTTLMAGGG